MPFFLVRNDITKVQTDAIVNAANTALKMGGGVCKAIFMAAGIDAMQKACAELGPIDVGEAVYTPAFNLPAQFVIHTAGPVYKDGRSGEATLLEACYLNSLQLADELHCNTIAFPLISSGIYGYPKQEALKVATQAIQMFLNDHDMVVYLVVFDLSSYQASQKLKIEVQQYLDNEYSAVEDRMLLEVEEQAIVRSDSNIGAPAFLHTLEDLDQMFSTTLLNLIKERGRTEVEVYKKANLDRKLFSKIRTGKGYLPSKRTILALAVALELNLSQTDDLLALAGYTLSRASKFDLIVQYFISNGLYDLFEINEVLFSYDQPLLGS